MLRPSLPSQTYERPFKARIAYEIDWGMSVQSRALPVEPCDDSLGVPDVSQQLDEAYRYDELIGRGPSVLAESLQMPSRDASKPRLIGLRDTRECLL
jgi:hypothetical protein